MHISTKFETMKFLTLYSVSELKYFVFVCIYYDHWVSRYQQFSFTELTLSHIYGCSKQGHWFTYIIFSIIYGDWYKPEEWFALLQFVFLSTRCRCIIILLFLLCFWTNLTLVNVPEPGPYSSLMNFLLFSLCFKILTYINFSRSTRTRSRLFFNLH